MTLYCTTPKTQDLPGHRTASNGVGTGHLRHFVAEELERAHELPESAADLSPSPAWRAVLMGEHKIGCQRYRVRAQSAPGGDASTRALTPFVTRRPHGLSDHFVGEECRGLLQAG